MTTELSFNEKRFLEAYRRFFQEQYPASPEAGDNAHIKGQTAVYLLMLKQVSLGDYGFTWGEHGPHSPALQALMNGLDRKPEAVAAFYQAFPCPAPAEA